MASSVKKLFLIFLIAATPAFAEIGYNYRSKLGVDLRAIRTNPDNNVGWMAGLRAARFFGTSHVFLGLAGSYGAPTGDSVSEQYLYYGGLTIGYDGRLSRLFTYECSIITGYGEGRFKLREPETLEKSYFVFEPTVSLGFGLGGGWRLSMSTSYLHLPDASHFSGLAMGLRFEHRTSTAIREIND